MIRASNAAELQSQPHSHRNFCHSFLPNHAMRISPFCLLFALSSAPAMAQVTAPNLMPLRAPKMATVTPFISGLKEPQGMAFDSGSLLICDYGSGDILEFGRDGKPMGDGKYATGLQGPSAISRVEAQIFVSERNANRVLHFYNYKMDVVATDVENPIGLEVGSFLFSHPDGMGGTLELVINSLIVISPTTAKIYRMSLNRVGDTYPAYSTVSNKSHYGLRWIIHNGKDPWSNSPGSFLMTDETGHQILMMSEEGRIATFATGISKPSGLVIGPDKLLYVANESDGGQLIRINNEGEKTIVAEKLGRPSSILFLDAKTLLVSNRDGNIWRIVLP